MWIWDTARQFRKSCAFKNLSGDLHELEGRWVSDKEQNHQRQMKSDSRLPHFSRHGPVSQSGWRRGPGSLPDGDEPWGQEVCLQNCCWKILDPDSNRRTAVHCLHQVTTDTQTHTHCIMLEITHLCQHMNIPHSLLTEFCIVYVCFRSANSFFELEWRDGRVCVRAANGKYVIAKKNGQLAATVDNQGQSCFRCCWTDENIITKYFSFVCFLTDFY